jgi:gas vesicle protein
MNSTKLVTGLFIGAAAGLILGILFAPDKGVDTRRKIAEGAGDITDDLKDSFGDFVDTVATKFGKIKSAAAQIENEGEEKIQKLKKAEKISYSS